jgi:RHS repeat-associated protein
MEELVTNHVGALVVDRVYTYGLDLISQYKYESGPGSPYWDVSYYGYDGHGNVRFLTDSDGNITDTYDYDAFGTLTGRQVLDPSIGLVPVDASNESLVTQNHYLYCGEQFDPDLGLYFLRARYMDPERGRFWTMDVWEGVIQDPRTLHKYLYVNANPVFYEDPSGHMTLTEMKVAIAIIAIGAFIAAPPVQNNRAIVVSGFCEFACVTIPFGACYLRCDLADSSGGKLCSVEANAAVFALDIIGTLLIMSYTAFEGEFLLLPPVKPETCADKFTGFSWMVAPGVAFGGGISRTYCKMGQVYGRGNMGFQAGLDLGAFTVGIFGVSWALPN